MAVAPARARSARSSARERLGIGLSSGPGDRLSVPKAKAKVAPKAPALSPSPAPKSKVNKKADATTQTEQPRLPSLLFRQTLSQKTNPLEDVSDGSPMPLNLRLKMQTASGKTNPLDDNESPMPYQLRVQKHESLRSNPLEDDMPFHLSVQKIDSNTSGSDAPQVPAERSQWELASLDPSSWPSFGITSEGFAGIGVVTDGLIRDSEKSLHFALDEAALATIAEGSSSFNSAQFKTANVAGSLQGALAHAHEQNQALRQLCWEIIHLGRDLEESGSEAQLQDHEQLLTEARRYLQLIHGRLLPGPLTARSGKLPTEAGEPEPVEAEAVEPSPAEAPEAPEVIPEVKQPEEDKDAPEVKAEVAEAAVEAVEAVEAQGPEGTPEIPHKPDPGPHPDAPSVSIPSSLTARIEAQRRQSCPNPNVLPSATSPSQSAVVLFSPQMRLARSLVCPSFPQSLARSVTCPVRHSPPRAPRAQNQQHLGQNLGQNLGQGGLGPGQNQSVVVPRLISGDRRSFCGEPITRAASPYREPTNGAPAWKFQGSQWPAHSPQPRQGYVVMRK